MTKKSRRHFNEDEIRPRGVTLGQKKAILTDINRLLVHRAKFVRVNCPACDGRKFSRLFTKNGFRYCRCDKCQTLFVNPRPPVKLLERFYSGSRVYKYWEKFIFPQSEKARREKIMIPRVKKLLEYCRKLKLDTNSLVEIGAGYGTFCAEVNFQRAFGKIVAIEPSRKLAARIRRLGIEVRQGVIEKAGKDYEDKFNAVVSFEVVEHTFSPREFVKRSWDMLKMNGLLYLTCPNITGFDLATLGPLAEGIDHEHLNYFSPDSMKVLLNSCGFKVIEINTPGRLDAEIVRRRVLSNEYSLANQPFLKTILIDKWQEMGERFQDFLSENRMSSSLEVIAQKVLP